MIAAAPEGPGSSFDTAYPIYEIHITKLVDTAGTRRQYFLNYDYKNQVELPLTGPSRLSDAELLGSATAMIVALNARRISAEELLRLHLERVAKLNPAVNAIVTVDEEAALEQARRSDRRRRSSEDVGALEGLPMTVKDCLRTAGMRTVAGAPFLQNYVPTEDAASVARLKDAGAVIFGKSNTPVMASDLQTENPVFGLTRNPWNLDRTPGGSSGGAGAALALGLTPLEVGSDIAGSVRIPAHACGIYAHKPTLDVIPERGHIPPPPGMVAGSNLGTIGPMTRTAEDLSLAFDVLSAPSQSDGPDWRAELSKARHDRLSDYRIAVWHEDEHLLADDETRSMIDAVAAKLGHRVAKIDTAARPFEDVGQVINAYLDLVVPILASGLPDELIRDLPNRISGASESSAKYLKRVLAARHQSISTHFAAKEIQARAKQAWKAFFKDYDAVICPTLPRAAYPHRIDGLSWGRTLPVDGREQPYWDQVLWCGALANFAHLPATARPVQISAEGMPLGIQIVGPFMEDRTTIQLAKLLDDVFGGFNAPPLATSTV